MGKAGFSLQHLRTPNNVCVNLSSGAQNLRCPNCNSTLLWKNGYYTVNGDRIQRFKCRSCGYRFSEPAQLAAAKNKYSTGNLRYSCQLGANKEAKNLAAEQTSNVLRSNLDVKLLELGLYLQKEGLKESTITPRLKLLKILCRRGADLLDPESIKKVIAKQAWCPGRKANAVDAYTSYLKYSGGRWTAPHYVSVPKIPFVPKEAEIDQLIAGCSRRIAAFLQFLKDTGARAGEVWRLTWDDVDFESCTVSITPEKGSRPRIFPLRKQLFDMLQKLPKLYGKHVFSHPDMKLDDFRDNYAAQRRRVAAKTGNPRLNRIMFKTLRTWKGTMEYHKTKDILHVMHVLGHKNIKNTMIYIQLDEALFKDEIDYVSKIAKTEAEACVLIEAGFEYICDFDGHKLFRRRKQ